MTLSLSVRIAESFHSKETASVGLDELAAMAAGAGYSALCMGASQVGSIPNQRQCTRPPAWCAGTDWL
jgi:hypothetical protein